ncbi:MAG TPA: ABC transporter permease [Gammaproteobacteria bacterium]|nr:ABC transporter permease [Gammaproteobacteria bacterium]
MTRQTPHWPTPLSSLLGPLGRNGRFSFIVILILGLGIGINVATLGLLYRYDVSPLPWPQGGRIVTAYFTANQSVPKAMSIPTWQRLRKGAPAMADSGLYKTRGYNLSRGDRTLRLNGAVATASVFSTLGVQPALGRVFGHGSDKPGAKPVVVLSYHLWEKLFSASPSAVGKTLKLNGKLFTIIGVMPKDFNFPSSQTALWTPRIITGFEQNAHMLTALHDQMIARLAPGRSIKDLERQSNAVLKNEIAHFPVASAIPLFNKYDFKIGVQSWRDSRISGLHQSITMMQFATTLLMLLVWFNLANLFLARTFGRRGELNLRRILGASTWTITRTLAGENFLLSLAGAGVGVVFGRFLLGLFSGTGLASAASSIPGASWPILIGIAFLLALVSTGIFTLVGLGFLRSRNLSASLREGDGRASQGPVARRIRMALLVSQIALACALTGCGLLLGRSLLNLNAVNLGFKPDRIVTAKLAFPEAQYPVKKMLSSLNSLRAAVARQPGMNSASVSSDVPFDGETGGYSVFPRPVAPGIHPSAYPSSIDREYLKTIGLTLLAGRNFTPADTRSGQGVAIIDSLAAKQLFGTEHAVGREFSFDSAENNSFGVLFRVIGVVSTVRNADVGSKPSMGNVYVDSNQVVGNRRYWSWASRTWYVSVRSSMPRAAVVSAIKKTAHRMLPGIPLYDIKTMNQRVAGALASNRMLTVLVALFAIGALILAAIGLYAVQAYAVAQRAREFAIRLALGAERGQLLAMVLGEAARLLVIGLVAGLVGLAGIGVAFASAFYGISPFDPVSMIAVAAVLCLASLAASWLPARRAGRTLPAHALRS